MFPINVETHVGAPVPVCAVDATRIQGSRIVRGVITCSGSSEVSTAGETVNSQTSCPEGWGSAAQVVIRGVPVFTILECAPVPEGLGNNVVHLEKGE